MLDNAARWDENLMLFIPNIRFKRGQILL